MNLEKAKRVEELRAGKSMHSWRALSEIICDEFGDEDIELKGNQLHGYDLCVDALEFLYGSWKDVDDEIKDRWAF